MASVLKFNPFTGNLDIDTTGTQNAVQEITTQATAGENISALKFVYVKESDNKVYLANQTTIAEAEVVGITKTAVTTDNIVEILIFGTETDASFTDPANKTIYLATNGDYTLTPPTSGIQVELGKSLGQNTLLININEPIII